jgi:DNA-binding IclR family transcriptional regulator
MLAQASNKAKIARRVVEVLQFFDESHPQATVMDIVRRYDRPQSSTSELLSSLVELGILYKDGQSRSYRPTPRAAMLGGSTQAPIIRDGRLTMMLDRLQAQSGLTVALFGLVGVEAQVFNCRSATNRRAGVFCENFAGGQTERLTDSAVGRLLLSTLSRPRREGIVRRLNAEANGECIPYADMLTMLDVCERKGMVTGDAGFGVDAEVCAALLPAYAVDQPMAVGFVYRPSANIDTEALQDMLKSAIHNAVERDDHQTVTPLVAAA